MMILVLQNKIKNNVYIVNLSTVADISKCLTWRLQRNIMGQKLLTNMDIFFSLQFLIFSWIDINVFL